MWYDCISLAFRWLDALRCCITVGWNPLHRKDWSLLLLYSIIIRSLLIQRFHLDPTILLPTDVKIKELGKCNHQQNEAKSLPVSIQSSEATINKGCLVQVWCLMPDAFFRYHTLWLLGWSELDPSSLVPCWASSLSGYESYGIDATSLWQFMPWQLYRINVCLVRDQARTALLQVAPDNSKKNNIDPVSGSNVGLPYG